MEESGEDKLQHDIGAVRDRHIRLRSVQTDLALGLPVSVHLPHGQEPGQASPVVEPQPFVSDRITELRQMCIKPPPNRTIYKSDPIPFPPDWPGFLTMNRPTAPTPETTATQPAAQAPKPSTKKQTSIFGRTMSFLRGKRSTSISSPDSPSTSQGSSSQNPSLSVLVPSHRYRQMSLSSDATERESSLTFLPSERGMTTSASMSGERWTEERRASHSAGGKKQQNK